MFSTKRGKNATSLITGQIVLSTGGEDNAGSGGERKDSRKDGDKSEDLASKNTKGLRAKSERSISA